MSKTKSYGGKNEMKVRTIATIFTKNKMFVPPVHEGPQQI